jgi:uncharacterized protein (DUF2141 family)
MKIFLMCFYLWPTFLLQSDKNELKVKIQGLKNAKGTLLLEILSESNKPVHQIILPIKTLNMEYSYTNFTAGNYAVRVFQDINNNKKLDTNAFGLPKEPWGVSNNVPATLGPPSFQKMLLACKDKTITSITLR